MFDTDISKLQAFNMNKYVMNQTKEYREGINYNAFYSAIVVNTNDTLKLGRVQVRIPSLHGVNNNQSYYIKDENLPWAKPGVFNSAGNDMGQFLVPAKGTRIFVTFEYNSPSNPIYFGGIPTIIGGKGNYKEYNDNPDIYDGEEQIITDNDEIKTKRDSEAVQVVYKSFKGATIEVDDKDGQESIRIIDASGQVFEMGVLDPEGAPLARRGDKENSDNIYRFIRLGNKNEFIEIIDGKVHIAGKKVEIDGFSGGGSSNEVEISDTEPTEESVEMWVDLDDDGPSIPAEIVKDKNYVHTDNNFTDVYKNKIDTNEQNISDINDNISSINDTINDQNIVISENSKNIRNNASALDGISKQVSTNKANIQVNTDDINTNKTNIENLKSKLDTIEDNAQVNKIEKILHNGKELNIKSDKSVDIVTATKLSDLTNDNNTVQDANYVHTDNNFTNEMKEQINNNTSKLNNIEDNAQVNKIEKIKVNNVEQTISNKEVNIEVPTKLSDLTNDNNTVQDVNYTHTDNNFDNINKEQIQTNKNDITTLKSEVNTNKDNITKLNENKLNSDFTDKLVKDIAIESKPDSVKIKENRINPKDGSVTEEYNDIPIASNENVGLMTKESYKQIQNNTDDITTLKQMGGKYIGVGFDTHADLVAFEITDDIKINDFTFVRVDETQDNSTTRYVVVTNESGVKEFQFAYIINEETYGNFQDSKAGLIVGANSDGKIFAESDGTGSVVGWDNLNNKVNSNTSKLNTIEDNAQVNKIEKIKVNNVEQTISNKEVNIEVPTKLSDLENDNNTVQDVNYVHTDNNFTNELKQKVENTVVPTKLSDLTNDNNTVQDANYVHTDNNFDNTNKEQIQTNKTDIANLKTEVESISIPTKVSELENDSKFITANNIEAGENVSIEKNGENIIINSTGGSKVGNEVEISITEPSEESVDVWVDLQDDLNEGGYVVKKEITGDTTPIGAMMPFSGTKIPEGWLLCNGDSYLKKDYKDLFNVIGYNYLLDTDTEGDYFRVPDMRKRTPVGLDENDEDLNAVGKTGGEKTHRLTVSEMPSHRHKVLGNFTGASGTEHTPQLVLKGYDWWDAGTNDSASLTGGDLPHNNMQPYSVYNYIIKAFTKKIIPDDVQIINNLESDSETDALSAKQGKELKTLIDNMGGGDASSDIIVVGNESDITKDTKIFIDSTELKEAPEYYSEVVDSLDGNETDKAPSVRAVNDKMNNLNTYSTEEQIIGTWIDGKPLYRKVITGTLANAGSHAIANLSSLNLKTVIKIDLISNNTDPISSQFYSDTTSNIRCYIIPSSKSLKIDFGSKYPTVPLDYVIILEYTKTTD